MKTFIYTIFALLFSFSSFAQNEKPKDKYTIENDKVFVERYDENGNIKENGSYLKSGELDGKWVAYRADGSIKSIAYYKAGKKVGHWLHYDSFTNEVHQVNYDNNAIASVETTSNNVAVAK
jgi:antitoxin component YwqK of YwqJK toxin-antitoxin module